MFILSCLDQLSRYAHPAASATHAGGRVRITARLIEAAQNKHLWAEKLDGVLSDFFALQDTLTMKIVRSVSNRLEQAEIDTAKGMPTTLLEAYDLYAQRRTHITYHPRSHP